MPVAKRGYWAGVLLAVSLAIAQTGARRLPGPIIAGEGELFGGPFAVNVGPHSATVGWVTGNTKTPRAGKVTFNNLQPGTRYCYDFQADGKTIEGSFKTPPTGPAPFQFVVYGDTQSGHRVHRRIVDAILITKPDFLIHTGDLVDNGKKTSQWKKFFEIERALLRSAAFFPAAGNHERNSPLFFEFLQTVPYYSFDWGSAHFTILQTDFENIPDPGFWQRQLEWLEKDLAANQNADLRFVAFHRPPYSAKKNRGINPNTVKFVPLFEKYNVTAVFSGHDHAYEHFLSNGIHYFVSGGGGGPLYDVDAPLPGITLMLEKTAHFLKVSVDGKRALLEAVTPGGRIIDHVELRG